MNWSANSISKLETAQANLGKRSGPNVQWLKEKPDDTGLRVADYKFSQGIPSWSAMLNDWESGLACLAGMPNSGKSTILVNMMLQALDQNKDLMIVDISLDDPFMKRYQQYLASLTGLFYQEITTKTNLSTTKRDMLEQAKNKILRFYQEDRLRTIEPLEKSVNEIDQISFFHYRDPQQITRLMKDIRQQYPKKKIAFFIDAWNNLDLSGCKGGSDLSQANYCLAKLQEESQNHDIMCMLSAHLRKTDKKRSDITDIKGTSDMSYNVVWAGIVRNELRENTLKNPLVHMEEGYLFPVVVVDVVKTKVSTWDHPWKAVLKSGSCTLDFLEDYEYKNYYDIYMGPRK